MCFTENIGLFETISIKTNSINFKKCYQIHKNFRVTYYGLEFFNFH